MPTRPVIGRLRIRRGEVHIGIKVSVAARADHSRQVCRRPAAQPPKLAVCSPRSRSRCRHDGDLNQHDHTIGVERLPPLMHLMHEALMNEPYIHFDDDTTVQVLKSDRPASANHYMFVLSAGPPGRRIVRYMCAAIRNATILKMVLSGPSGPYRGKAVCDGFRRRLPRRRYGTAKHRFRECGVSGEIW